MGNVHAVANTLIYLQPYAALLVRQQTNWDIGLNFNPLRHPAP